MGFNEIWTANYRNEKFFIDHHLKRIPPFSSPRIMINVGAHKGEEAFDFAARGWNVYSFEANPANYANLQKACSESTAENKPLFIPEAISPNAGKTITFYVSDVHPGIGSLSSFAETHRPIEVKARTLRSFYEERNIKAIDLFLMDAERMDFSIIQTHDWSIPIGVLVLEFNAGYVRHLVDFVARNAPHMKHAIFMHKKADGQYWQPGKENRVSIIDRVAIDEYERRRAEPDHPRFSTWGNIVFYQG